MVLFKGALKIEQQVILMPTQVGYLICILCTILLCGSSQLSFVKRSEIHVAIHFNYVTEETEKYNIFYNFIEIQIAVLKMKQRHDLHIMNSYSALYLETM